jgi:hypothetical protein
VSGNDALRHVSGFGRIETISRRVGECRSNGDLTISGNAALTEMLALPGFSYAGHLSIGGNTTLPELPRWRSAETNSLEIVAQPGIVDLHRLAGVETAIAEIESNPDLRTLDGLDLGRSAFRLAIFDNPALESLGGAEMHSLGSIEVWSNPALADVSAFRRLDTVHDTIFILWNPDLDQQHAEQVVEHLEPAFTKIAGNANWSAPDMCPWTADGACDEDTALGPALCRPGTDAEDCAP